MLMKIVKRGAGVILLIAGLFLLARLVPIWIDDIKSNFSLLAQTFSLPGLVSVLLKLALGIGGGGALCVVMVMAGWSLVKRKKDTNLAVDNDPKDSGNGQTNGSG
jgi:hypothetical protein